MLVASTTGKGDAVVTIYERVNGAFKDVKVLAEKDFPAAGDKALFNSYVSKAKQLAAGSKGTPRGQTPPPAQTQKFAALKALQHEVVALEAALINRIAQDACPWLGTGCFAAGTKLLTRRGWVAVELLAVGDELASRAEGDPGAGIEWQAVEECFRRTGRVLHLHFTDGELVRTTPEHPFWVEGAAGTRGESHGVERRGRKLARSGV